MLNNVMIGRYYSVKSKIHAMNPLAKIICTFLFLLITLMCSNIILNIVLIFFVLIIANMTHISMNLYFKTIKSIRFIIIFIIIINLILKVDVQITLVMIIRLSLIVMYTTILTLTTPPNEITYSLEKFFAPLKILKVPVNKMALTLSLALRFIPTIIDQGNRILKTQASRGIDYYNSNFKGKLLAIKSLILPMVILTIKKADQLADSMEIRLYNINEKRTNFRLNRWGVFDTYLVLMHLLLLIIIFMKEVLI